MKTGIRGRQSIWAASRFWPLSLEGGRGKSSLETNIRGFMADSAVSLSFEQDWTCLSEGEIGLPSTGYSKMGQCIKNGTQLYTYKLMKLMWFHGHSTWGFYKLRLGYKSWQPCEPGNLSQILLSLLSLTIMSLDDIATLNYCIPRKSVSCVFGPAVLRKSLIYQVFI